MKTTRLLLCLLFAVMLLVPAFAYTIVGDSVIQEDTVSRLQVTPHTASTPTGKDYTQLFELTNKTAVAQNVYVAYKFDKALVSGKVDGFVKPVYDWVENQINTCAPPLKFTYQLNRYPGNPNPNFLHCYAALDNNTPANPADDYNITQYDLNFSSGNLAAYSVSRKNYTLTAGNTWTNVTSAFSSTTYLNDTLYYLASPIAFDAGETKKWRLTYTPNATDTSKKWEMVFYTGANAACILNSTCTYVQWLDPWWNSSWIYKRQLTVTNHFVGTLQDTNNSVLFHIGNELGAKALANCNDVRVIYENGTTTELDRNIVGNCQSDANIYFPIYAPIANGATDAKYYLYYGNALASAPSAGTIVLPAPDSKTIQYCSFDGSYNNVTGGTNCSASANVAFSDPAVRRAGVETSALNAYVSTNMTTADSPTSMTVEMWVDFVNTTLQRFFGYSDSAPLRIFQFSVENSGYLRLVVYNAGALVYDLDSQVLAPTSGFHHIAFTCGASGAKFYLDANLIASNASTTCPDGSTANMQAFTMNAGGEGAVSGTKIDELRITKGLQRTIFPQSWGGAGVDTNAEQPTASIGAELLDLNTYNITFNVYRKNTSTHLTNITADWNDNAYDVSGQNSPFSEIIYGVRDYLVTFSRTGYDNNTNFLVVADSNKTYTIYLADTTAPSVGVTTLSGFKTSGAYINGTGTIVGGIATDAGSGIDTSTCQYTANNGGTWAAGTWNVDHCEKTSYAITNAQTFQANTRVSDLVGNTGTGTATSSYTGDTNAPYTSISIVNNPLSTSITLTCNDPSGAGCKLITYRTDAGAWTYFSGSATTVTNTNLGSHTFDYYSTDNVDNNQSTQSTTFGTYGALRLRFYDENTTAPNTITGVSVTFNGTTYPTGTDYNLNLALQGITTGSYVIQYSKTGYGTRSYQADLNQYSDLNKNLLLLASSLGSSLAFKFYSTDGNTELPNTYVEFSRISLTGFSAGRLKTTSSATASFFVNTSDQNYNQLIADTDTYTPVALTVLQPLNLQTLLPIGVPWYLAVTQNMFVQFNSLTTTKTLYLLPNTTVPYLLSVSDSNFTYLTVNYSKIYLGNPGTDTLQPYLLSSSAGVLTTLYTLNAYTNQPFGGITIEIYKTLPSLGRTLIQSVTTDSKGTALVLMALNETYEFDYYYNGAFIRAENQTGTGASIYIKIDPGFIIIQPPAVNNIFAKILPTQGTLDGTVTALQQVVAHSNDFNSTVTVSSIRVWITDLNMAGGADANVYNQLFNLPVLNWTNSIPFNYATSTVNGVHYDQNDYLLVNVLVILSDGNQVTASQLYTSAVPYIQTIGWNLRPFFGCAATTDPNTPCTGMLLAAVFISLFGTIGLAASTGYTGMETMGVFFMGLLGLFTYFTWVPQIVFALLFVGTIGIYLALGARRI